MTKPRRSKAIVAISLTGTLQLVAMAWAAPASAHGSPDSTVVPSVNYHVELAGPDWPGVKVAMVDNSDRVEVANSTSTDVIVLGYDGEPYLRIGPEGAFENLNSPATYLNRSVKGGGTLPDSIEPDGPPSWRQVSKRPVARFHDHRTHWMGSAPPDIVVEQPDRSHVIIESISIELRFGDQTGTTTGQATWAPPPSPLPWWGLAGITLLLGGALAWRSRLLAALMVCIAGLAGVAAVVQESRAAAGSFVSDLVNIGWLDVAMAVAAFVAAARVSRDGARAVLVICGIGAALLGGADHIRTWGASYPGTTAPWWIGRGSAALALGAGLAGAAALAARHRATDPDGHNPPIQPAP